MAFGNAEANNDYRLPLWPNKEHEQACRSIFSHFHYSCLSYPYSLAYSDLY
jgi:hypothetical protein